MSAEIKFVRPDINIPVRRGKSEQYKIIKFVKNGNQLELLQESGNWAKVRLTGGTEGWMLKRFLSDEKPPIEQIRELRKKNEELKTGNAKLTQDLKNSKELSAELEQLQRATEEKIALRLNECNKIKDKYNASQEVNNIMWFLSGAGVLLAGWLLGRFAGGSQKKRNRLI